MDCPNCNERPVGLFHSFRLGGLNFKERTKGYFKCKNCGTTLRQKRSSGLFPRFRKGFWVAYPLLVILFASFAGYILTFMDGSTFTTWQIFTMLGGMALLVLIVSDELRYRYWMIEESDPNSQSRPVRKLTKKGWAAFLSFTISSVAAFLGLQWYIDMSEIGLTFYMIGYVCLLMIILAGAVFIVNKFSKAGTDI